MVGVVDGGGGGGGGSGWCILNVFSRGRGINSSELVNGFINVLIVWISNYIILVMCARMSMNV